ncbi:MAG: DNA-3-methyladenine glycosylase [Halobacteria archaeon]
MPEHPLPRSFFNRDPAAVARDLLGHLLLHRSPEGSAAGAIVETEAYYGAGDPASRARRRTPLSEPMWGPPGRAFVYMVHNQWLFNVVTGWPRGPSAVLIRAVEPRVGVDLMVKRRGVDGRDLARGPGRMTRALGITRAHSGLDVTNPRSPVQVVRGTPLGPVVKSHRIGVSRDLKRKLRFCVGGSRFVSRQARPT